MADPDKFKADISKWVENAKGLGDKFVKVFCLELAAEIQEATPVKTGNLRSAWRSQLNSDPGLNNGVSPGGSAAGAMRVGDTFYLTNNTEYAIHVEFGTRPHNIFPKGPPDGAKALHWKAGGQDHFSRHVWHPGTEGQAFVRGVLAKADTIAQTVADRLGTSSSS